MKKMRFMVSLALCLTLLAPAAISETRACASPAWYRQQRTYAPQPVASQKAAERTDMAAEVVRQVNAERAKARLSPLRVDAELTRAARVRAAEIAVKFSHTRPDGSAWSTVSGRVYGENIAMGQKSADKVMAAWLTSQGHRANILRPGFGSIGVCCYIAGGVTYWVQLFGK